MKRALFAIVAMVIACCLASCAGTPNDRTLRLSGKTISEAQDGGVVRWLAVDKYGSNNHDVRFQIGFFKDTGRGFVLFEGGTLGEYAYFSREGLNLRWDWGNYSILLKPDGTCLYYDFSYQITDVKPSGHYSCYKF